MTGTSGESQVSSDPARQIRRQLTDLAISQGCGQAGGQVSRELANPQVGAADTSATDMVVVPAAQELATWVETNRRTAVSGQVANRQVSSMNTGQTKGDLTCGAEVVLAIVAVAGLRVLGVHEPAGSRTAVPTMSGTAVPAAMHPLRPSPGSDRYRAASVPPGPARRSAVDARRPHRCLEAEGLVCRKAAGGRAASGRRQGLLGEMRGDERGPADLLLLRRLQIAVLRHQPGHPHAVSAATHEIAAIEDRDAVAQPGDAEPRVRDIAHRGQVGVHEHELDGRGEDPGEQAIEVVGDDVPRVGMRGGDLVDRGTVHPLLEDIVQDEGVEIRPGTLARGRPGRCGWPA